MPDPPETDIMHTLNDLILINNDRLKEYKLAMEEAGEKNSDLDDIFAGIIEQIQRFNRQLETFVTSGGYQSETETSISGKLHRIWLQFKFSLHKDNRKNILIACERCEDAVKEAYQEALYGDNELNETEHELIARQLEEQKTSHRKIKELRDDALRR